MKSVLTQKRLRHDILNLSQDLAHLYKVKYPRMLAALEGLSEEALIEHLLEMCDIFDLYRESVHEVAKQYQQYRLENGSLEDRDWPEN